MAPTHLPTSTSSAVFLPAAAASLAGASCSRGPFFSCPTWLAAIAACHPPCTAAASSPNHTLVDAVVEAMETKNRELI
nr:unnamed protein product [Digitaria exilis]